MTFIDSGFGTNAYRLSGGAISGAGAVLLEPGFGGSVQFNAANDYSGGTTVSNGTIIIGANGALGSRMVTLAAGVVKSSKSISNPVHVSGTTTLSSAGGNSGYNGPVTGAGTLNTGGSGHGQSANTTIVGGSLNGFTGTLVWDHSVVNLNNLMLTGASITTAKLRTTGLTTGGGRWLGINNNIEFGELSGDGGRISTWNNGSTLTINQSSDTSYGGELGDLDLGRVLNITKTGTGTLSLTYNNDYLGTTAVNGGTLAINGDQSGATGSVTVGGSGTLAGKGTVGGETTVNGALKPGTNSVDTLSFAENLTLASGSTTTLQLVSTASHDVLNGDGANTLTGEAGATLALDFAGTSYAAGETFTLFTNWANLTDRGVAIHSILPPAGTIVATDRLFADGTVTLSTQGILFQIR
jgi:fibronectin-binding autotransporter adhesin